MPAACVYIGLLPPLLGKFTALLSMKERKYHQTVFVVKGLKRNLSGLPAIQAMQLISRVETLETQEMDIPKGFPKCFKGLGNLGDPYKTHLKEDAQPHAIYTHPSMFQYPYAAKLNWSWRGWKELDKSTKE